MSQHIGSRCLIVWGLFTMGLTAASAAVLPYIPDANTPLLYHLNEAAGTQSADTSDFVVVNAGTAGSGYNLRTLPPGFGTSPFSGDAGPAGLSTSMNKETTNERAFAEGLNPGILNAQTFTMEMWVRNPNAGPTYPTFMRLGDDHTSTPDIFQFGLDNNATTPRLRLSFRGTDGGWKPYTSTETVSFSADTWYHVAVSYSGDGTGNDSEVRFYFDAEGTTGSGTLLGTAIAGVSDVRTSFEADSMGIFLGSSRGGNAFTGDMDEARYSTVVRTEFNVTTVIPEPSTGILAGIALLSVTLLRKRAPRH